MEDISHPAMLTKPISIYNTHCTTYEELINALEKENDNPTPDSSRFKLVDLFKDEYRTFPLF
jgi:hypothetical protein